MKTHPFIYVLTLLGLCGCQQLALTSSQAVLSDQANAGELAHDQDTFSGRLASSTQQMGESLAKPFDPAYWQSEKPRRKPTRTSAHARTSSNGFFSWLKPKPKPSPTMREWLARERPEI